MFVACTLCSAEGLGSCLSHQEFNTMGALPCGIEHNQDTPQQLVLSKKCPSKGMMIQAKMQTRQDRITYTPLRSCRKCSAKKTLLYYNWLQQLHSFHPLPDLSSQRCLSRRASIFRIAINSAAPLRRLSPNTVLSLDRSTRSHLCMCY